MTGYFAQYAVVFISGLAAGALINSCICSMLCGKPLFKAFLHCAGCGVKLKPFELIPLIGTIALICNKRRRDKDEKHLRRLCVELLTAGAFVALYHKYMFTVDFLAFAYLLSILAAVVFIDMERRIIPDELVIAGLIGGIPVIVYNIFFPMKIYLDGKWWNPLLGIIPGVGFLLVAAVIGMLIYGTDDAMGMGDVKIFAPIGIFLGWRLCMAALLMSILLAGMTSFFLMVSGAKKRKEAIPFGPFIAAGAFIAIMLGTDIIKWYTSN